VVTTADPLAGFNALTTGAGHYEVGTLIYLGAWFANGGVMVDPVSITGLLYEPDGTLSQFSYPATITRIDVGVYRFEWVARKTGDHAYQYHCSGNDFALTVTKDFYVRPTQFTT